MIHDVNDYDRVPDLAGELTLADNPDQRTPCVLVLDTSYSMSGAPIAALNEGLRGFQEALQADALARRRVEVALLTFGGTVAWRQDFVPASGFTAPVLEAGGNTPLGAAVSQALEGVAQRTGAYRQAGVPCTRPWVFLITDGAPTDAWQGAAEAVYRMNLAGQVAFFAIGVEGADMQTLGRIAPPERPPQRLEGLKFGQLFEWLSMSLSQASRSAPGQQTALPPIDGWAQV